jgi:lysophospholipase L1-like esterase
VVSAPLLLPVALFQGLWVKATTPRLPPARGHRGHFGEGDDTIRVVGVGDSIIAGVGVDTQRNALVGQFARRLHERTGRRVEWHVHGLNGATSAFIAERIAPRARPADVYLVSAGVNDVTRGVRERTFAANVGRTLDALRERSPDAVVIFTGVPPLAEFPALPAPLGPLLGERARRLQAAASEVVTRDGGSCFDFPGSLPGGGFARDGFHPSAAACGTWAEWLLELWLSRPDRASSTARAPASPPK